MFYLKGTYRLSHKSAQKVHLRTLNDTAKSMRVCAGVRVGGAVYRAEFTSELRSGHPALYCGHPPFQSEH